MMSDGFSDQNPETGATPARHFGGTNPRGRLTVSAFWQNEPTRKIAGKSMCCKRTPIPAGICGHLSRRAAHCADYALTPADIGGRHEIC
jgi:hypothetical protein